MYFLKNFLQIAFKSKAIKLKEKNNKAFPSFCPTVNHSSSVTAIISTVVDSELVLGTLDLRWWHNLNGQSSTGHHALVTHWHRGPLSITSPSSPSMFVGIRIIRGPGGNSCGHDENIHRNSIQSSGTNSGHQHCEKAALSIESPFWSEFPKENCNEYFVMFCQMDGAEMCSCHNGT